MKNVLICCLMALTTIGFAQRKKKEDIQSILNMCGCYEIAFNFAETFGAEEDYEYHDNYYSGGLEWVFPIEQTKDKVVLQHLLVIGDTMIIKHWRQDWIFENTELYVFDHDNQWHYQQLEADQVKGQWTQKVFQVDDSPRYEGNGTWVHFDGRHYWESTADAPLPRREFSKRKDYNVMVRRNRQEITDYGWLHEQDNQKVIRDQSGDQLLASEKGWNTYSKVEVSKCQSAVDWWNHNQNYWSVVRSVWDDVFGSKKTVQINMKVDNKTMFMRLFELGDQFVGDSFDSEKAKQEIERAIQIHLVSNEVNTVAIN